MKTKQHFFVFNPKSYITGEELYKLAEVAEKISNKTDVRIYMTAPYADLSTVSKIAPNITVTAQHMDGIDNGVGMGAVLPSSLYNAGVRATFLNHAEKPLKSYELVEAVKKAKEIGIETIVCASSIEEAGAVAVLDPDIILCEPTDLIGTGKTSSDDYILTTNNIIKKSGASSKIMQAAGIMTPEDVERVILLGADGTGCTSGILKADNPADMLEKMILAIDIASKEVKNGSVY